MQIVQELTTFLKCEPQFLFETLFENFEIEVLITVGLFTRAFFAPLNSFFYTPWKQCLHDFSLSDVTDNE